MKVILQDSSKFLLRLDEGEDLHQTLGDFLFKEKIFAAHLTGIGTAKQLELGYYESELKVYKNQVFSEDLEILTFSGNAGLLNERPALHLHGSFSRADFSVIGGHIQKLIVGATCEINILKLSGEAQRGHNSSLNLNLLQ